MMAVMGKLLVQSKLIAWLEVGSITAFEIVIMRGPMMYVPFFTSDRSNSIQLELISMQTVLLNSGVGMTGVGVFVGVLVGVAVRVGVLVGVAVGVASIYFCCINTV